MTEQPPSLAPPRLVASAIIEQDGKYLLVQEAQLSAYGLWNFPGGHVDEAEGETPPETAVRETREETNLTVRILGLGELAVVHSSADDDVELHAFEAEVTGGSLRPQPGEILDAGWFTEAEILALGDKLRSREYIEKVFAAKRAKV